MSTTINSDKIIRTEFNQLKTRIRNELIRRGLSSSQNTYSNPATATNLSFSEHYNKIVQDDRLINANDTFPDYAVSAGTLIKEAHVTMADGWITAHENKDLSSTSNSDCSGGCVGACVNMCSGCTGLCTAVCQSDCVGSCDNNVSVAGGGCNSCNGECSRDCAIGCVTWGCNVGAGR